MDSTPVIQLRPGRRGDVAAIAAIWHAGWADGHTGHVPAGLADHRTLDGLTVLTADRIDATAVAVVDDTVVGFVTVRHDEIEQVYVAPSARGTGVVTALLDAGEATIARTHSSAWLAVVAGNARARRCYERHGWTDDGTFSYTADTADGPFTVPARRYVKTVTGGPR